MYKNVNFNKILLVEPMGVYKKYIKEIIEKENALWIQKAASSSKGLEKINFNKDKPEKSSFLSRRSDFKRKGEKVKVEVEKDTLDKIVEREKMKKSYGIKIDTEGYDMEVIKGSKNIIKSTK